MTGETFSTIGRPSRASRYAGEEPMELDSLTWSWFRGISRTSPLTSLRAERISKRKPELTDTEIIITKKLNVTHAEAILPLKRILSPMKRVAPTRDYFLLSASNLAFAMFFSLSDPQFIRSGRYFF